MRHRTTWYGIVLVGLLAAAGTIAALAEEPKKEGAGTSVRPMEIFACKYKEGKGLADLQGVSAKFNASESMATVTMGPPMP